MTSKSTMIGQVSPFAVIAGQLAANTVSFINANRESDTASTPFARSLLGSLVGNLLTRAMAETLIIAAMGAPKSPSTGKAVKNVSGLRNVDGGARLYQAWKDVALIIDNIDADKYLSAPGADETHPEGLPGAGAIRPAVVAFILGEGDIKSLFGAKGITAKVKALMADHGTALAALNGVSPEAAQDAEQSVNDNAPQTLGERAAALLVALQAADDETFMAHVDALAALADTVNERFNRIAEANPPAADETAPIANAA